jgi:putative spermidine/putrescine transport system ATP-binding protein
MARNSDVIVEFADVQKSYDGEVLVIRNLDLDIGEGEFLTLLGPSGSGKTTTLLMLAGFESPTGGDILLRGVSITKVPPYKRNFGMVFQHYALFPHMTVLENVMFPLAMRKMDKAEARTKAERALDIVQLCGFETRKPSQLSGGQQQRVALARALVFEPVLVLMDEPLGALDKQLREQMQIEIKHLHGRLGITVVYVTHDQSEALTMSDRIAVFEDGVIQQIDSPTNLYENPRNSFVAQFIGENNTLHGTVESVADDECSVILDSGERVIAKPVNVDGVGCRTTLSLRPERLVINSGSSSCPNRFRAKVLELIYLGDYNRYRVKLAGNNDFVIKIPNSEGTPVVNAGDEIDVCWQARHCRALDPMVEPSAPA